MKERASRINHGFVNCQMVALATLVLTIGTVPTTTTASSKSVREKLESESMGAEPTERTSPPAYVQEILESKAQALRHMDDVRTFKLNRNNGISEVRIDAGRVAQVPKEVVAGKAEELVSQVLGQLPSIIPKVPAANVVVLQDTGVQAARQAIGCQEDSNLRAQNP